MTKLFFSTLINRNKQLSKQQELNDSDSSDPKSETSLIPLISRKEKIKGFLHYFTFSSIMDESTFFGTIWFIIIYSISLYNTFTVSFRFCFFNWFSHSLYWLIPDLITDVCLYIDLFLRFFKPYRDKKTMRVYRNFKATALHYLHPLKGAFLFHIITRFNFEWFSFITGYSVIYRVNKVLLLVNTVRDMETFERTKRKIKPGVRKLIQFLYSILLISHFMACCWYLIVRLEGITAKNWVQSNIIFLPEATLFYKYTLGMYWCLVVMGGYGGSLPVTDIEVVFTLFVCVCGLALIVVIVGTVGNLVTNLDVTATSFREKMDSINSYMSYRNLSPDLKIRVTEYYNYLWKTRKGLDETKIIRELPAFLRADVAMYLNRDIINKVELFRNASPNFISEIVVNLKPRVSLPGSYIIRIGEPGREMYFINKGQVKVKLESGICVATLGEGAFFGEMALISGGIRGANIIAQTFCDLFVLDKADFDEIMDAYPEDADAIVNVGRNRSQVNQSHIANESSRSKGSSSNASSTKTIVSEKSNPDTDK